MIKYAHDIKLTLLQGLTTNQSLYLSILTAFIQANPESTPEQRIIYTAATLAPFLSRISINNIRNSLRLQLYLIDTPTQFEPSINITELPEPPQNSTITIKAGVGRPRK